MNVVNSNVALTRGEKLGGRLGAAIRETEVLRAFFVLPMSVHPEKCVVRLQQMTGRSTFAVANASAARDFAIKVLAAVPRGSRLQWFSVLLCSDHQAPEAPGEMQHQLGGIPLRYTEFSPSHI